MTTSQKPTQALHLMIMILFVWNIFGILAFFMDVTMDTSTLDAVQQEFRNHFPLWTKIVYALAVGLGTLGSFGLMRRKSWSKTFLALSLLCVIIQMYHSLFVAGGLEIFGASIAVMPTIVVVISITLVWIAQLYERRGWFN
jgi:surface polysaccharide O-acyltransferase-like enzyme